MVSKFTDHGTLINNRADAQILVKMRTQDKAIDTIAIQSRCTSHNLKY